jgi:exodeoxyribonuclease VII small subunit
MGIGNQAGRASDTLDRGERGAGMNAAWAFPDGHGEIEYAFARLSFAPFDARPSDDTMARSGKPTADAPPMPASYEEALAELEQLVGQMESGALPLDHLLASYQRGAQLLQFCRGRLEAVEQQVKLLEDGQLKPWDEA